MQRSRLTDTQRSWLMTGYPFTIALMVLKFLSLFLITTPSLQPIVAKLVFIAPASLSQPWTLVTYSTISGLPFLSFLFDIGITYWFCGSLERSWGTKNFAIFFGALTVFTGLALSLGAFILRVPLAADGLLPVAASAFVWGVINAEERVSLYFIPMRGIHVGVIAALYIMFQFASESLGGWASVPFALLGCGLAYLWVRNGWQYGFGTLLPNVAKRTNKAPARKGPNLRLVPPVSQKPKDDRFTIRDLNPLEFFAKRKRRKQFEKLMRDD